MTESETPRDESSEAAPETAKESVEAAVEPKETPPAPTGNGTLLEAQHISKVFGGLVAVNDVNFTVPRGGIVSLIGPNGAGKTTFFNAMTGLYKPTTGRVIFEGKDITGRRPDLVTNAGIARTFQNIKLFRTMTAIENVQVGMHGKLRSRITGMVIRTPFVRREERESRRAGARAPELRRAQAPLGARDEPALRRPAAARDRPRARRRAQAAAARRADGGHEPAGVGRAEGAHGEPAHREGHLGPAHRARHEGRDERVRPHHRAGPRREDRRGLAAGGARRTRRSSRRTWGRRHERRSRTNGKAMLRPRRHPHLLRLDRGAEGHLDRGEGGRGRHADRLERRRQVDDAALDLGPDPAAHGQDRLRRAGDPGLPRPRGGGARDRAVARRPGGSSRA